jgi:hypothetical protein
MRIVKPTFHDADVVAGCGGNTTIRELFSGENVVLDIENVRVFMYVGCKADFMTVHLTFRRVGHPLKGEIAIDSSGK